MNAGPTPAVAHRQLMTLIGFLIGASIPAAYGLYLFVQVMTYESLHPPGPNEAGCGMPMLGALLLFLISPAVGAVSGSAFWLASAVFRSGQEVWQRFRQESSDRDEQQELNTNDAQ